MNQSINTDNKNSKEPQQKYSLGTVSIKILGGLNRFYGRPTHKFPLPDQSKSYKPMDVSVISRLWQDLFIKVKNPPLKEYKTCDVKV